MNSKKILIIWDNFELVEELKVKFKMRNYEVATVSDGKRGLYKAFNEKFDLIIIDDKILGVSMVEVCRQLKSNPDTTSIPVFILSDETEKDSLQEVFGLGINSYVVKPVDTDIIAFMVNRLLTTATSEQKQPTKPQGKKSILVIDDEPQIVKMLKIRLEANNYHVIEAYDGESGLNLAHQEKPDLIILDVVLPKIDGFKLCRILKFDKEYKNIPIILFTARTAEESRIVGHKMGANAYVNKPFNPEILLGKIKELIG